MDCVAATCAGLMHTLSLLGQKVAGYRTQPSAVFSVQKRFNTAAEEAEEQRR